MADDPKVTKLTDKETGSRKSPIATERNPDQPNTDHEDTNTERRRQSFDVREQRDREGRERAEKIAADAEADRKLYADSMAHARDISDSDGNELPHDENNEAAGRLVADGNAYVGTQQQGLEVRKTIHLTDKGAKELASYKE